MPNATAQRRVDGYQLTFANMRLDGLEQIAAHGQRRNGAVVTASACARGQRTGGVSSTERYNAGLRPVARCRAQESSGLLTAMVRAST